MASGGLYFLEAMFTCYSVSLVSERWRRGWCGDMSVHEEFFIVCEKEERFGCEEQSCLCIPFNTESSQGSYATTYLISDRRSTNWPVESAVKVSKFGEVRSDKGEVQAIRESSHEIARFVSDFWEKRKDWKTFKKEYEILKRLNIRQANGSVKCFPCPYALGVVCSQKKKGEVTVQPAFAMELLEDFYPLHSLKGQSEFPFDAKTVAQLGLRLLDAFDQMYQSSPKIAHRDISPNNVMVRLQGGSVDGVRLLDFGLSRFQDDSRTEGTRGTRAYLAPECVARNKENEEIIDHRNETTTDIWSFGAILYYARIGEPPFVPGEAWRPEDLTRAKYSQSITSAYIKYLEEKYHEGGLSDPDRKLESIIEGCTEFNPQKRKKLKDIRDVLESIESAEKSAIYGRSSRKPARNTECSGSSGSRACFDIRQVAPIYAQSYNLHEDNIFVIGDMSSSDLNNFIKREFKLKRGVKGYHARAVGDKVNLSRVLEDAKCLNGKDLDTWLSKRSWNDVKYILIGAQSKVTNTRGLFARCDKLIRVFGLEKLETSRVTDMSYMFDWCLSIESLDLSHFDTSHVTDMSHMFDCCCKLKSLDLSHFDTSRVTDMSHMFRHCPSLTSLDLSSFDMSGTEDKKCMFDGSSLEVTFRSNEDANGVNLGRCSLRFKQEDA